MSQLPLFGAAQVHDEAIVAEAKPLHRRQDSTGSKLAARDLVASGRRNTHEEAVLEALSRHPWQTSLELDKAEHGFLSGRGVKDRAEAARRLPGLLERKLIVRLDPRDNPSIRPCRIARSLCFRWALVGAEGAEAWLTNRAETPVIDQGEKKALGVAVA
ncbi:MAG: hypothetical protein ABI639_14495 [Thermoanaerobaculia bacterium]